LRQVSRPGAITIPACEVRGLAPADWDKLPHCAVVYNKIERIIFMSVPLGSLNEEQSRAIWHAHDLQTE
jgi:hypothetical protein